MKYAKPHLSVEDQLQRLMSRGMQVDDVRAAEEALRRIGYYRLSAYWYHWREEDQETGELLDTYHPVARFEDSLALYSFDRRLRLSLLDAIESIEIALRVAVAYVGGRRDPFIHTDPAHLGPYALRVDEQSGLSKFDLCSQHCERLWNTSSEDFAKHARSKYEDGPAIWVAIETWDFGLLSNFYKMLLAEDQQEISESFLVANHSMFESWIASLNYVRNLSAHHSRLFRKSLVVRPGTKHMREIPELSHINDLNQQRVSKAYPVLAILAYLMRTADPESSWVNRAVELFDRFEDLPTASLADYGFPDDWKSQLIWV